MTRPKRGRYYLEARGTNDLYTLSNCIRDPVITALGNLHLVYKYLDPQDRYLDPNSTKLNLAQNPSKRA